jgi:pimeloyl-ACP methyl ester carboxylesterase
VSDALHVELVIDKNRTPERALLVLHGVFGAGRNWRLYARKLAAALPDWALVLVDLRGHGASPSMTPPHDLDAAARDLVALEAKLAAPVRGVVGHSLGGKIALVYSSLRRGELDQVWSLDSAPGTLPPEGDSPTRDVLALLRSLPPTFPDRQSFIRAVEAAGHSRELALWLATSLVRGTGAMRLGLDLEVCAALLADHYRRDLWSELERDDGRRKLHVVVAGRSFVWQPGDRERLAAAAARSPALHVHTLENAGHWVHVDAPDELHDLLAREL